MEYKGGRGEGGDGGRRRRRGRGEGRGREGGQIINKGICSGYNQSIHISLIRIPGTVQKHAGESVTKKKYVYFSLFRFL